MEGKYAARETIARLLQIDEGQRARVAELAATLAASAPDAAFVCIETAVDAEVAAGRYEPAAGLLREFVGRAPGQINALLKLVEISVDYTGFTIPDQFVVGYGLDYGELYRNLRFVGVLRPEVYTAAE